MTHPFEPGSAFYSTSATVIATLYVALAVELRLLRPHTEVKLPDDPRARRDLLQSLLFLLPFPVASLAGLYQAIDALDEGGSHVASLVVLIGVAATVLACALASLHLFIRLLGEAMPSWIKARRRPIFLVLGLGLVVLGIVMVTVL